MSVTLNLVVVRVADLERSRAFYAGLGLALVREQHGDGPVHYACSMLGTVLELYPATDEDRPGRLRLGFCVNRFDGPNARLIRQRPDASVYLLKDPDGNSIELTVPASG